MKKKSFNPAAENPRPNDAMRLRIIDGAGHHFFAHGFRSVTMDDVAKELGMSKKTLYSRFDTKLQLLDSVIENKFRRVREDFARILTTPRRFPEMLQTFLDCLQRHMSEIQPSFLRDMRQEGPEVFLKVNRLRRDTIQQYFGELMQTGRKEGFIRKDIPAHIIIEILLAAVQAIVTPTRVDELGLTPKTACALITRVVLEGAIDPASRTRLKNSGQK